MSYTLKLTCSIDKNIRQRLGQKIHAHFMHTFFGCMHTMCRFFLGPCTLFLDIEKNDFSPSFTGSFRIPVSLIGLITSPTSLDRNSKVLFSVVLKGLKSLHSLHGVHEVCTGLPPDVRHHLSIYNVPSPQRRAHPGCGCNATLRLR